MNFLKSATCWSVCRENQVKLCGAYFRVQFLYSLSLSLGLSLGVYSIIFFFRGCCVRWVDQQRLFIVFDSDTFSQQIFGLLFIMVYFAFFFFFFNVEATILIRITCIVCWFCVCVLSLYAYSQAFIHHQYNVDVCEEQ